MPFLFPPFWGQQFGQFAKIREPQIDPNTRILLRGTLKVGLQFFGLYIGLCFWPCYSPCTGAMSFWSTRNIDGSPYVSYVLIQPLNLPYVNPKGTSNPFKGTLNTNPKTHLGVSNNQAHLVWTQNDRILHIYRPQNRTPSIYGNSHLPRASKSP